MSTAKALRVAVWTLSLAVPAAAARIEGDLPRRADLGFGTRTAGGALVARAVRPGSPAAAAGLRDGDRLLAAQDEGLGPPHVGRDRLRRLRGGERVTLRVEREGRAMELSYTPPPLPLEELPGLDVVYGVVDVPGGARLRSVVTRPAAAEGALPAIFLTQWVSCDGVEPLEQGAWGEVLRGLITRSGAAFLRVDRSSGGDSEGPPCHELDYDTELAQYRAAFDRLTRAPGIDPERVVVFGMSLGSTTAPLVAEGRKVAGLVVSGGGGLTYFERMLAFDRLGFERGGAEPGEVDALVRRSAELHVEYLLRDRDPEAIAAERPHLKGHWSRLRGTGEGTHYGRPYAWHRQAARKDFMKAWSATQAPVLVVHGTYDQFEPPHAHEAIGRAVERVRPGAARVVGVEGMNHFYRVFADPVAAANDEPGHDAPLLAVGPVLEWLRHVVGFAPQAGR